MPYADAQVLSPTDRVVRGLRLIVDPLVRINACDDAAGDARELQADIARVRRQAIYEATLVPGETGGSVAATLGISPKAVSSAIADFRKVDLDLFRRALGTYLNDEAATSVARSELQAGQASRDVLHAAKTVLRAHNERTLEGESEEVWELLEDAADRARQLAAPAGVLVPLAPWDEPLVDAAPIDYSRTEERFISVMRALNCLPGIKASCSPAPNSPDGWSIWIVMLSEQPRGSVAEYGPSRLGWLGIEWLVWFFKDLWRAGFSVEWGVGSAAPFLNSPGHSMSFFADFNQREEGLRDLSPANFRESLVRAWNEYGPVEVQWPEAG